MKKWNFSFRMKCLVLLICLISVTHVFAAGNERGQDLPKVQLLPPSILAPADRTELRGIYKVLLTWSKVSGAAAYHVVLARDRRFRNIAYEDRHVVNASLQVENLGYGTYFLKMSSVGSDGSEGPFSDMLTFVIVPPPPLKTP